MTDGTREVEWQFDAPDLDAVDRWLNAQPAHASLSLEARATKHQRDTYFDTTEWRLFNAGYSLRARLSGDATETTLKSLSRASEGPVARVEVSAPGDPATVAAGDTPAATRLRLMLHGASIRPLFTVTTYRRVWLVRREADVLAEIALDATTIAAAGAEAVALSRVEVEEVLPGGLAPLDAFLAAMCAECALTSASQSKFQTGLAAAGFRPGPPDLGSTEVNPDDRAVDRAYAVLRRRGGEFLARESGTALGEDVEQLHDMRVATRRLRAAIRVFDTVLPPALIEVRDEFRWFAQVLGAVRDLDVQVEHLEQLRGAASWAEATALAPLVAQMEQQRITSRAALLDALDSERYARMTTTFRTALLAGPPADASDITSRDAARRVIARRYRRFEADARLLRRESPRADFHALRIRGKRLRYSLELFIDLYGRAGARALASLRALQDLLGELQDLATTDERLGDLVREPSAALPSDTLVIVGRLLERHERRASAIVRAFPRARAGVLRDFRGLRRALRPTPPAAPPDVPTADTSAAPAVPTSTALVPLPPPPPLPPRRRGIGAVLRLFRRRP